jgi:hypothetical protein
VASTFRRLQAAAITDASYGKRVKNANREPDNLINLPAESFPLFMTTRDWLKALDASCTESFFERTADGHLVGREIDDWDGIGVGVDLEDDWMSGDEASEGDAGEDGSDEEEKHAEQDVDPAAGVEADAEAAADAQDGQQLAAAGGEVGRRHRRRAAAAGAEAAGTNGNSEPVAVKHRLADEITYVSTAAAASLSWFTCIPCAHVSGNCGMLITLAVDSKSSGWCSPQSFFASCHRSSTVLILHASCMYSISKHSAFAAALILQWLCLCLDNAGRQHR